MALNLHSAIKTDYPFLAHPPPQKQRPLLPLPPPPSPRTPLDPTSAQLTRGYCRRSSTSSAIASWAAHVQPGSPASLSPRSPYRRPSLRRTRCPSATSVRAPSVSFLHIAPTPTTAFTPTPSVRDFKADLTTVGYTSVFLQLPHTPVSATLSLSIKPLSLDPPKHTHVPPVPSSPTHKPRGFTPFRSFSALRSRGRSKFACPASPTKMKAKAAATSAAIIKRKKAKYAMRPPPLANEIALMQFVDGGKEDDNIKRIMEAQAKASGAAGLADVYRDEKDDIWWDRDEKWEYTHLLAEGDESRLHATSDLQWVTFGCNSPSAVGVPEEERRGSMSTQGSDLDPSYVVQPVDSLGDLTLFGDVSHATPTPISVLSLPHRSRRAAQHLRKPDFIIDAAFSRPRTSFRSQKHPSSSGLSAGMKPKGKARRRPAPLKLSPPSPAFKQPTNSPIDADKVRKEFIDASFEPTNSVSATPVTPATTPMEVRPLLAGNSRAINVPWQSVNDSLTSLRMKKKPSVLNTMGLFRPARKEDVMA